jgi:zinc transport system ATP-binding protein
MTNRPTVVSVRDVCFSYTGTEVLHNVSFTVQERDLVAVVGPNGGGKSTLLRILLGLLEPRYGTVRVLGGLPKEARRRIGYVPQHISFDQRFPVTAFDVVRMGRVERRAFGRYSRQDNEAARQALERVGMINLRNRPFSHLSGGERQRVLIAHALAAEPAMLLLDEPTANVDPMTQSALHELFHALNETVTIIFVSHNVNVVTRYVTHVLCVNRTAALHPIGDIISSSFKEAHGGELAVLLHDLHCHITDVSRVMHGAHAGEQDGGGA